MPFGIVILRQLDLDEVECVGSQDKYIGLGHVPAAVIAIFNPLPSEGLAQVEVLQELAHLIFEGPPALHRCCKFLS